MTFQQLQYFVEVYKAGSFSKAAESLFITTSSLSISISTLEKELGHPLFVRTQKGLTLTAAGQKVLDHATHICERHRQLSNIQSTNHASLRISAVEYPPCINAFSRFLSEYAPTESAQISYTSTSVATFQKLCLFETDIGIIDNYHARQLPLFNMLRDKGLDFRVLKTVPVEMIIGPKHRLYHKETILPQDLADDIFIDNILSSISRSHYLKGIMTIPPQKVVSVERTSVRYELLEDGVGYTIFLCPNPKVCKDYGFRRIPLENVQNDIICLTNPSRPLSMLGQQYLALLEEELAATDDT